MRKIRWRGQLDNWRARKADRGEGGGGGEEMLGEKEEDIVSAADEHRVQDADRLRGEKGGKAEGWGKELVLKLFSLFLPLRLALYNRCNTSYTWCLEEGWRHVM